VTSHNVILLASGDIDRHTSMGLFPLNIYHRILRCPTNYPVGYPGNKLSGYGSPNCVCHITRWWLHRSLLCDRSKRWAL